MKNGSLRREQSIPHRELPAIWTQPLLCAVAAVAEGPFKVPIRFLDIEIDEAKWPAILERCSFDYMKKNADSLSQLGVTAFEGRLKSFIHKGTNGSWRDVLTREDIERYERAASENLSADCAHWLATGESPR